MDGDSTESRLNGEGSKELLAPDDGPRENLINTAVKFLQNPNVMSSPLYQKKAFLEKKGLTQKEISIAIQRSGVKDIPSAAPGQESPAPGYQPGLGGYGPQTTPGYYVPIPPKSGWARARDFTVTTVAVASVSYAIYKLFQTYLQPILFGRSFEEKRLERLESRILDIEKSVADSLSEMNKILGGIQVELNRQLSLPSAGNTELRGISELKADIASLKGLLLNKNQFPPAPSTSPVLPSWQRLQAPPPVSAASPSYADVVKTSGHSDHHSAEQIQEAEITNSPDPSSLVMSSQATHSQANEESSHSESQDLSLIKLTNSDSSLS